MRAYYQACPMDGHNTNTSGADGLWWLEGTTRLVEHLGVSIPCTVV